MSSVSSENNDEARRKTGFTHFYVWECVESSEVRGRGGAGNDTDAGERPRARIEPCGWGNIRKTVLPLSDTNYTQGRCTRCGRRPQLNEANCQENPVNHWEYFEDHRGQEQGLWQRFENGQVRRFRSRSPTGAPNIQARREWAENRRDHINATIEAREAREADSLSTYSNTLEHQAESFEQGGEILE
jgi:hypothetical protein